jgi:OOP family OmpA-OmpF porin
MQDATDALFRLVSFSLFQGLTMFKKIALVTAVALLSTASFAAENRSFYAGADVGSTKFDNLTGRQTSFGGFFGYKFSKYLAVEASYRRLADYEGLYYNNTKVDVRFDQTAASVIGILPLSSGFEVFGRFGRNRVESKGTGSNFSLTQSGDGALYGVGVAYIYTPNISVRLELQSPSSDSKNVSAGVSYTF